MNTKGHLTPKVFVSLVNSYYDTNPDFVKDIERLGCTVSLRLENEAITQEALLEQCRDSDVFVANAKPVTKEMMETSPNLKLIAVFGAGYNQIDIKYAKERGITVTTARGGSAIAVAELAFSLMLALARKTVLDDSMMRKDKWLSPIGVELYQKTLGVIGLGVIGKEVLRIGKNGFSMDVLVFDPFLDPTEITELGGSQVDLDYLLAESDFVSVHVPLSEKTKHLISTEQLNKMKSSAFLVDLSRGGIIDEAALIKALRENKVAGAGLDVHSIEPVSTESPSPYKDLSNVILTSHAGAGSEEAVRRIGRMILENIEDTLEGMPPRHNVIV